MELFEEIRREYEFGVGTIAGVARKVKVHRRMVRGEAIGSAPELMKGHKTPGDPRSMNRRISSASRLSERTRTAASDGAAAYNIARTVSAPLAVCSVSTRSQLYPARPRISATAG